MPRQRSPLPLSSNTSGSSTRSSCAFVRDREPKRFDRAALRWHGRYCREVADVTLEEGQAVVMLRGERAPAAARALADLFDRRLLLQASEALVRWADGRR